MEHSSHEEYVVQQRIKVALIASKILSHEMTMLEGAREIVALRYELELDEMDKDILDLVTIQSETDSLPIWIS